MTNAALADQITDSISKSKKYRGVYVKTISRIVEDLAKKYHQSMLEKKSREKLHQIWGAYYMHRPDFAKLLEIFKSGYAGNASLTKATLPLIKFQSSTRERAEIMNDFYNQIFSAIGKPASILDLACGFNPLAIPWMKLSPTTAYLAVDIYKPQIEFLNSFFSLSGYVNAKAKVGDIFVDKFGYAEAVFLLKTLPCLEKQCDDYLFAIEKLKTNILVISFPTKSLSGKKILRSASLDRFKQFFAGKDWKIE